MHTTKQWWASLAVISLTAAGLGASCGGNGETGGTDGARAEDTRVDFEPTALDAFAALLPPGYRTVAVVDFAAIRTQGPLERRMADRSADTVLKHLAIRRVFEPEQVDRMAFGRGYYSYDHDDGRAVLIEGRFDGVELPAEPVTKTYTFPDTCRAQAAFHLREIAPGLVAMGSEEALAAVAARHGAGGSRLEESIARKRQHVPNESVIWIAQADGGDEFPPRFPNLAPAGRLGWAAWLRLDSDRSVGARVPRREEDLDLRQPRASSWRDRLPFVNEDEWERFVQSEENQQMVSMLGAEGVASIRALEVEQMRNQNLTLRADESWIVGERAIDHTNFDGLSGIMRVGPEVRAFTGGEVALYVSFLEVCPAG